MLYICCLVIEIKTKIILSDTILYGIVYIQKAFKQLKHSKWQMGYTEPTAADQNHVLLNLDFIHASMWAYYIYIK